MDNASETSVPLIEDSFYVFKIKTFIFLQGFTRNLHAKET